MLPLIAASSGPTALVMMLGFGLLAVARAKQVLVNRGAVPVDALLTETALTMSCGLLGLLILALCSFRLTTILWLAPFLGLAAASITARVPRTAGARLARNSIPVSRTRHDVGRLALAIVPALMLVWLLMQKWIVEWDARSIWFFHAKMLFFENKLPLADYLLPQLAFSHPDYPQLIPVLGAIAALFGGGWNEKLPLMGLAPLLVCECVMLVRATTGFLVPYLLLCLLLLWTPGISAFLNGYADAHVVLLALCGALFLGRWLEGDRDTNLPLGILCLGLITCLKNEGLIIACVIGGITVFLRFSNRLQAPESKAGVGPLGPAILAMTPLVIWTWIKWHNGLANDLATNGVFARLVSHLNLHDLLLIAKRLSVGWIGLAAVLAVVISKRDREGILSVLLLICSALIYTTVLFIVYMTTPYDLVWHLDTSAARVASLPKALVAAAIIQAARPALLEWHHTRKNRSGPADA